MPDRLAKPVLRADSHMHDRLLHLDTADQADRRRLHIELLPVHVAQRFDRAGERVFVPAEDDQPALRCLEPEIFVLRDQILGFVGKSLLEAGVRAPEQLLDRHVGMHVSAPSPK